MREAAAISEKKGVVSGDPSLEKRQKERNEAQRKAVQEKK